MKYNLHLLSSILISITLRYGNKIALITGRHQYTYYEIYRDSILFSHYLKGRYLPVASRVLIESGNSYVTVISFWGSLLAECIPCVIDSHMDSTHKNILTQNLMPGYIVDSNAEITDFNSESFDGDISCGENRVETDLAIIMHTSGSTGFPKGVMLSHRNVLAAVESITAYLDLKHDDVILNVLPMHFDYGLYQMLLVFSLGATLVLEKNAIFPQRILNQIRFHQVTVMPCVPSLIRLFYKLLESSQSPLQSVRLVTNTGEYLSPKLIDQIKQLFPTATIFSMYGLTECKRCSYIPPDMLTKKIDSIGIAMPNLRMWVQDQTGAKLPPGVEGELVISGPTVMLGYWRDHDGTSKKISQTQEGLRILHTGDRVIMDEDHFFYFRGRDDAVIKFNGVKLNCQELIKSILIINGVSQAHLFLELMEGLNQLILCIEHDQDKSVDDETKFGILKCFLPYQKPSYIFYSQYFPVLSNGKLDKKTLERVALNSYQDVVCK